MLRVNIRFTAIFDQQNDYSDFGVYIMVFYCKKNNTLLIQCRFTMGEMGVATRLSDCSCSYILVHGPDKNLVPPRGTKAHMVFVIGLHVYIDNEMR